MFSGTGRWGKALSFRSKKLHFPGETSIRIAGFGGQGVVLAGNIAARGFMAEDRYVTGMVSYGVEMRGGTANATLVVSDEPIASPIVTRPGMAIILNQQSLDRFEDAILPDGLVVLNSSLVTRQPERSDLRVYEIDASKLAQGLGDVRVANIIALGAFVKASGILKGQSVEEAIKALFSIKKPKLSEINITAFRTGMEKVVAVESARAAAGR